MLKRLALSSALAVACAVAVGAQTPATGAGQQERDTRAAEQAMSTTIEGCLYKEQDIPGRTPNIAERAGVLEDYILVEATPAAATEGTVGTTGTAAAAPRMFKLEHVDDDRLSALVGKRVTVTGKIDAEGDETVGTTGAPAENENPGPDEIELPEFEVTSIQEAAGECPATPAVRR